MELQMKILLIRHGERTKTGREEDSSSDPLSAKGENQVAELAARLKTEDTIPTLFLTSRYKHAQRTAEILQSILNPTAALVHLDSLTPLSPSSPSPWAVKDHKYVGTIREELSASLAAQPNDGLSNNAIVVLVLHHPRQIQVALQLQGLDPANWGDWNQNGRGWPTFAQSICLVGEFDQGKAKEIKGCS
jgi:broad specificity phosphatase PhoE